MESSFKRNLPSTFFMGYGIGLHCLNSIKY